MINLEHKGERIDVYDLSEQKEFYSKIGIKKMVDQ